MCFQSILMWFLFVFACDRFIGQQPDGILLDPDDSFWCQALEDLETCGQSELLREIEVNKRVSL